MSFVFPGILDPSPLRLTNSPIYTTSPLRLGAESGRAGAAGTPGPVPEGWLAGPKQLTHSPHRGPAALAIASAGDMLLVDDSGGRDWGWGIEGQRENQDCWPQVSPPQQPGKSELRTSAPSPASGKQDPLTHSAPLHSLQNVVKSPDHGFGSHQQQLESVVSFAVQQHHRQPCLVLHLGPQGFRRETATTVLLPSLT